MKRVVVLVVVVAAVVALASFLVRTNAAVVNGTSISQSTLNGDLSAIAGSANYQCYLEAASAVSSGPTLLPANGVGGSSTFNVALANAWLSQLVEDTLVSQIVTQKGLTVGRTALAMGRLTLAADIDEVLGEAEQSTNQEECGGSANAVLSSMPASFVSAQVQSQANQDVLLAHNAGYGLSAAELRRYYDHHRSDFEKLCVDQAVTTTSAAASAIVTAVDAGTAFDTAAAGAQTASGCVSPSASNYASLSQAVTGLSPGEVTSVLTVQAASSTQAGEYVVLQLTSRSPATFAASLSAVREAVLSAGASRSDAQLEVAVRTATVDVDARYGAWHPSTSTLILLPNPPPATTLVNPTVNVPGSSPTLAGSG